MVFGFAALLAVLVAGFWETYFSVLFRGMHITHHFHGVTMLLWVLLLITQAALVRTGRLELHRMTGRMSYVLAPLVVVSGLMVNFHFIFGFDEPLPPGLIRTYWFGFFLVGLFAVLYVLAMIHRRDFNLHARYMIATGLVFLVPGLQRAFANIIQPTGLPSLDFYQTQVFTGLLGVACIGWDRIKGQIRAPFVVFTVAWGLNLGIWQLAPHLGAWRTFSDWSASLRPTACTALGDFAVARIGIAPAGTDRVVGSWQGDLELGRRSFRTILRFDTNETGELIATLDLPEESATAIPVAAAILETDRLVLMIPALGGCLDAELAVDGRLAGRWFQAGRTHPITLVRATDVEPATPNRPDD